MLKKSLKISSLMAILIYSAISFAGEKEGYVSNALVDHVKTRPICINNKTLRVLKLVADVKHFLTQGNDYRYVVNIDDISTRKIYVDEDSYQKVKELERISGTIIQDEDGSLWLYPN